MNKLFTKVAALSVGLAMAIGVGVAVGGRSVKVAKAAEAVLMSCDMTAKTASTTGYSKEHTYGDYKIYGGQNNGGGWEYFKFGAKKSKAADPDMVTEGYIKSTVASTQVVTKIEVITLANGANSDVTWDVKVASDADFGTLIDTTTSATLDRSVAGSAYAVPSSGKTWSAGSYFWIELHITNHSTTNGCLTLTKVNFYYNSTTPRGEIAPVELDTPVFLKGSNKSLSYQWTPASGSSATITSHSWTSSNTDVATVSGDTCTAVGTGVFTLTLEATDSNSEAYSVQTRKYFVTNAYDFVVTDTVALYSEGASMELSAVDSYGSGTSYTASPNGAYPLTVEEGSETGSFAFVNDGKYLSWTSGNSLGTSTTKSVNTSWYVINHDTYTVILNAATNSREIWWNSGSPRFACYEGKTPSTSGYNSVALAKLEVIPVRGTVAITAPTATLLKKGTVAQAEFSWTPAEGSSATISSYTWTSSEPTVISVSGDTYTALAPGKAKLTLTATDSTGQEYTQSTSDITVVDVVSGSYEKKYNVEVGDTIAIVCETAETQMSGISSKIGTYVFYNEAPASVYDFVLEEGSAEGSFALKNSEDKYLAWAGSTDLSLVDEVANNASWTITFDNEGNATIANVALDGEAHRSIAWNKTSPRFAPYLSGQTAVQIYGPEVALEPTAVAFAQSIIDDLTCDANGKTAPSTSEWDALEEAFGSVTADGKAQLKRYHAAHHENPVTDKEVVEEAMAKYDYVVGKYGSDRYADFIDRDPAPVAGGMYYDLSVESSNNAMTIIIITVSAISVLAFTTLLVFKKKKQK